MFLAARIGVRVWERTLRGPGLSGRSRFLLSDECGYCDAENAASVRVLEKSGLVREGVSYKVSSQISPEPRNALIYEKVR